VGAPLIVFTCSIDAAQTPAVVTLFLNIRVSLPSSCSRRCAMAAIIASLSSSFAEALRTLFGVDRGGPGVGSVAMVAAL
jgi:hypothetical protein